MPRRAATSVRAMLNYGYPILETEAIMARHAVGLDPALGLMHTDTRYRGSLATDPMEPVRPLVGRLVLDLVEGRALGRGEVMETRGGVCRLGANLARELAAMATDLRPAVIAAATSIRTRLARSARRSMPSP
jgi:CRISPR/Cas system-associated endonuclease Cas1